MPQPRPATRVTVHPDEDVSSLQDYFHAGLIPFLFGNSIFRVTAVCSFAGFGLEDRIAARGGVEQQHLPGRIELTEGKQEIESRLAQLIALGSSGTNPSAGDVNSHDLRRSCFAARRQRQRTKGMTKCFVALAFAVTALLPVWLVAQEQLPTMPTGAPAPGQGANGSGSKSAPALTLAQAESRALENQPRLAAQQLRAQAQQKVVSEDRSAYYPQLAGNFTAVQANGDTAVAAGALTTSSISTRVAGGGSLLQLVTDFGRTNDLVRSARLSAKASGRSTESVRQQVLRDVDEAYFVVQAAESVRGTAQAVLGFRRLSLKQLNALAESHLKSTLDVEFAQVLVSEAEMALLRANSAVNEARAQLTAAMGDQEDPDYVLTEQPLPTPLGSDVNIYVQQALHERPDLDALRLQAQAAQQFANSERKLSYPTVNVLGNAGEIPEHDSTLHQDYGAIGVNLNVPIFNGGLYSSRAAEARMRAQAAERDATNEALLISRDVRTDWARAQDAFVEIDVAERLVNQTNVAMRLAQARYDAGLGSIVELNQAELDQTSALITAASARFDYMRARIELKYVLGVLP